MNRFNLKLTLLVFLLFYQLAFTEQQKPNIVLVLFDDVSPDMFSGYGQPNSANTPHIDALAKKGVMFKTCYGTAMCAPARIEIMTGRYANRTGVYHNKIWKNNSIHNVYKDNIAFGKMMKEAGYATAIAGKWHAGSQAPYEPEVGFDEYCLWEYTTHIDMLDGIKGNGLPVFNGLLEDDVKSTSRYWHPGYVINHRLVKTTKSSFGPKIETNFIKNFIERQVNAKRPFLAYWPSVAPHGTRRRGMPTNPDRGKVGDLGIGLKHGKERLERFTSLIEYMDKRIGEVVQKVKDLGVEDNTIFIITADNGTDITAKTNGYERGCHVLNVISGAGIKARGLSNELTDLSDIFPTLLELGGGSVPEGYELDGKSLVPYIKGESEEHRPWIYGYISGSQVFRTKTHMLEAVNPILGLPNGRLYKTDNNRFWSGYNRVAKHDSKNEYFKNNFVPLMEKYPPIQEQDFPASYLKVYKSQGRRNTHLFNHSDYQNKNGYGYDQDREGYWNRIHGTVSKPIVSTKIDNKFVSELRRQVGYHIKSTGGDDPEVSVHWGLNDGKTNEPSWQFNKEIGPKGIGDYDVTLGKLVIGKQYYFNVKVRNKSGVSWGTSQSFFHRNKETPTKPKKPNYLIVLGDDISASSIGCYGSLNPNTSPNIDQLAKEGVLFKNMFVTEAICAPTRAELYTGLQPQRNGCFRNHMATKTGTLSVVHHLRKLGYRVGLAGKQHFKPMSVYPFEMIKGFESKSTASNLKPDDWGGAIEFMTRDSDQPFCLFICSIHAHAPWEAGDSSLWKSEDLKLPKHMVDNPTTRHLYREMLAEVRLFDKQVGQANRHLKQLKLEDNTVLMVLDENGTGMPGGKWSTYDWGVRSACIMKWPKSYKANFETDAIAQYCDILPTMIDAAGGKVPSNLDGKSLLNLIERKTEKHRSRAHFLYNNREGSKGDPHFSSRAITDGRYKLIWNLTPGNLYGVSAISGIDFDKRKGTDAPKVFESWLESMKNDTHAASLVKRYRLRPEFQLFDLNSDPWEMNNLAEKKVYQSTLLNLKNDIKAWMKQQDDDGHLTGKGIKYSDTGFPTATTSALNVRAMARSIEISPEESNDSALDVSTGGGCLLKIKK